MNKEELRKEFAEETGNLFHQDVEDYILWLESKLTTKQESVKCGICIQNEINAERGVFGFNGQCTCFTVPTTHPKQPQQTVSDDAKKIHLCINLLSSMVYGGEEHSETSKQAISQARMALDKLQAQTNEGELIEWVKKEEVKYNPHLDSFNDVAKGYNMALKDVLTQFRNHQNTNKDGYEAKQPQQVSDEDNIFMYQHEETGDIGFVDKYQVDNGFFEINERLQLIGEYTNINKLQAQTHAIEFAEFSERWCFENSSYEFHELNKETKAKVYQEFKNQKQR